MRACVCLLVMFYWTERDRILVYCFSTSLVKKTEKLTLHTYILSLFLKQRCSTRISLEVGSAIIFLRHIFVCKYYGSSFQFSGFWLIFLLLLAFMIRVCMEHTDMHCMMNDSRQDSVKRIKKYRALLVSVSGEWVQIWNGRINFSCNVELHILGYCI